MPALSKIRVLSFNFFLATIGSILLSFTLLWYFNQETVNSQLSNASKEAFISLIETPKQHFVQQINGVGKTSLLLAQEPMTINFINSYRDKQALQYDSFKQQITTYYKNILIREPNIMQLRILAIDTGRELLRVERGGNDIGRVITVEENKLQIKSDRPYFKEGLNLKPDEFYLSPIEYNIENGRISEPPTKVIRAASAIYSENKLSGLVVINYMMTPMLRELVSDLPNTFMLAILDENRKIMATSKEMNSNQLEVNLNKMISNDLSKILYEGQQFIYYLRSVKAASTNKQEFFIAGIAPVGFIESVKSLSADSMGLTLAIIFPIIIFLSWWMVTSYYRLQNDLSIQTTHLMASEARHKAVLNTALDGIITINIEGIIESVNPAAEKLFGFSQQELIGRNINSLMPEPFRSEHNFYLQKYKDSDKTTIIGLAGREVVGLRKDGSTFPLELGVSKMVIDGEKKFTGIIRDITERKSYQQKIEKQAYYDQLTNLPNRQYLRDRLTQEISAAKRHGSFGAVLFIDLDKYKIVNDVYGHDTGDELLRQVSERLIKLIRVEDSVGRLGGDEFLVILSNLENNSKSAADNAMAIAEKIRLQLSQQYKINEKHCLIGASIGVCIFPDSYSDCESLIRHADIAMYTAKASGRNSVALFNKTISEDLEKRVLLEEQMRDALLQDQFFVLFQPIFNINNQLCGAESLVRWRDDHGVIRGPEEFIPVAEYSSIIVNLGELVIEHSFKSLLSWKQSTNNTKQFRLSINLSPKQLFHHNLVAFIESMMNKYQIDPGTVVFEITEGVALFDIDISTEILNRLSSLGVGIAIDDYGTGFSSLNYVRKLPVTELKIDRSLVSNISNNLNEQAIVSAIIELAKRLELSTVAEGIESETEYSVLKQLGCNYYQGFYFERPVSSSRIAAMLNSNPESETIPA